MDVQKDSLLRRTAQNSFSGTIGGIAVCLTGHPFDTLKVSQFFKLSLFLTDIRDVTYVCNVSYELC